MQTQQILGVVGGGMRYPSKTTSAKSSETSFEQLIQMSQNVGNASDTAKKPAETTKQDAAAPVKEAETQETTTDVATDKADTSATAEEKPELTKAEDAKEATDVEAAERAAGILAQLTEVVKDILDLTDEQLTSFMEELGITDLNLLNPEKIVIGGGVADAGDFLFNPIKEALAKRAMPIQGAAVQVVHAELGNTAGVIGASLLLEN